MGRWEFVSFGMEGHSDGTRLIDSYVGKAEMGRFERRVIIVASISSSYGGTR